MPHIFTGSATIFKIVSLLSFPSPFPENPFFLSDLLPTLLLGLVGLHQIPSILPCHDLLLGLSYQGKDICIRTGCFYHWASPLKYRSTEKLIWARLGVSRTIYVNVDSPKLGFPYFNFSGEAQCKKHPVFSRVITFYSAFQYQGEDTCTCICICISIGKNTCICI